MDVGCWTDSGTRYGDLNQDYAVVKEVVPQPAHGKVPWIIAAVLDGHGLLGERVAQLAGGTLAGALARSAAGACLATLSDGDRSSLMQDAFLQAHQAALTLYDSPPERYTYSSGAGELTHYTLATSGNVHVYKPTNQSRHARPLECGTTCTALMAQGSDVCIANVGDSTAVLGWDDGEHYQAEALTQVHCGLSVAEAERLRILDAPGAMLVPGDGYLAITSGAWAGYELSVTRALGHKHLEQYGVTWQPHVVSKAIQPHHCCLVLASDGVWEEMTAVEAVRQVMDAVSKGSSAKEAAKQLVEQAVYLAQNAPDADADNTTAVVLLFT